MGHLPGRLYARRPTGTPRRIPAPLGSGVPTKWVGRVPSGRRALGRAPSVVRRPGYNRPGRRPDEASGQSGRGDRRGLGDGAGGGARVVVADLNAEGGADTVGRIAAAGGVARFVATNVARAADVAQMVRAAEDAFGPVDILYGNAGHGGGQAVHETAEADWDA